MGRDKQDAHMISISRSILTQEYEQFQKEWLSSETTIQAHTSGSTGIPKQILLAKNDMLNSAKATNRFFGIDRHSYLFSPLSANYIAGKMMYVRAYEAACTFISESPSNMPLKKLPDGIERIDLMCVVPSQAENLLNNDLAKNNVKNVIVGGAPMTERLETQLSEMPWNTYVTYGMTETCSHVALRKAGSQVYNALPEIQFSTDRRNCLIISAPAFSFGTLVTNDVVHIESPTSFKWIGRYDNVINSGGIKFCPEELETLLAKELPVPFYIHNVPHDKWGETVGLTLEDPHNKIPTETILGICRNLLPRYAVPSVINRVAELPRTANGKLRR